jgi:SpoVK/Ycf46/Vps4 family AAA+-type ATPase
MKIKKMKADIRKVSHDAWRKDIEAEEKWLENCGEDEEFLKREGKRLNRDLLRIAPVYIGGSFENEKSYRGWESVAGLSDVIQSMKEVVILPLLYPEFFSSLGLTPPRGVLLHGHPGTGKTLVVRALIGACSQGNRRIAYFARKGADCLGKYVGDAERQLRLLFQVAEKCQPSIIFFDEMDGLAPCRSRQQDQTHNSVVATLLSLLDGLKSRGSVIVIGATNRPDAIDPALRRPGRFDREIYFPLPTLEGRSAILSLHTKNWPSPISGTFLSAVASQTVGYAGADLQAICTQAALNALKRACPLQDILRSAEKGTEHGRLPLPLIDVDERDWLSALAAAPPPCSQREAGIAANDLVSAPIDSYLLPCLLKPLLHLLISLCLDERIWLPSSLLKASSFIKEVLFSSMEKNNVPHTFWSSYLPSLIQQKDIANKIESILSSYGLTASQLGNHGSMLLSQNKQHEKFDDRRLSSTGSPNKGGLSYKLSGFRALVAGAPRSGQRHLVRCLLHGFMGQIVIHKLDLATMAQEGNGDILNGLTQILRKFL